MVDGREAIGWLRIMCSWSVWSECISNSCAVADFEGDALAVFICQVFAQMLFEIEIHGTLGAF